MQRWITVEGGEGVGKSTFVRHLKQSLESVGQKILLTREPGGSPIAESIRELFHHPTQEEAWQPLAELLALSAARVQHLHHKVLPALEDGSWVICDRFFDSTRIYQGALGRVPKATVEAVIGLSVEPKFTPKVTFLLDMDVAEALRRLTHRGAEATRFDRLTVERHELIRQSFLELARHYPERFVVLNAAQDPHVLVHEALACLRDVFGIKDIPQSIA
jgi:dTMP kinase